MKERNPPDPLERLLPGGDLVPPAGLEQRLRTATLGYVRRRRRMRRALQVSVVLCVVVVAAAIVWFAARRQSPEAEARQAAAGPLREQPRDRVEDAAAAPSPLTALSLEWQAFDSQTERASRYFRAGDQYLQVEGDYLGALRCYEQALASSGPANLEFSDDDNWLVLALKHARLKEMRHE
jgi:tetratricopeptide (TPR) repeat protein